MNSRKYLVIIFIMLSLFFVSCNKKHIHIFIDGICSCGKMDSNYENEKYNISFIDYDGTIIIITFLDKKLTLNIYFYKKMCYNLIVV